jgi:hypothetical protein
MQIETKEYSIELMEDLLGTVPKNKDIYEAYIADRAKSIDDMEEEIATVEEVEEKGWTGFHRDDEGLFLYNYMIKGFLKSALEVLMTNKAIPKIPAYKKWIDNLVHVKPRRIRLPLKDPSGVLERPLRAMTPQGPRVTLTRSDFIANGSKITFNLQLFTNEKGLSWSVLNDCFEFGEFVGLGQWRSGGYGQFKVIGNGKGS